VHVRVYISIRKCVHTEIIILFSFTLIELRNFKPINYSKIKNNKTKTAQMLRQTTTTHRFMYQKCNKYEII